MTTNQKDFLRAKKQELDRLAVRFPSEFTEEWDIHRFLEITDQLRFDIHRLFTAMSLDHKHIVKSCWGCEVLKDIEL